MAELFASGRIVDLILGFTVLEGIALLAWRRKTGRGLAAPDVLSMLLPGMCLLVALRCTMVGAWWGWTATCLLASLVTHLADLGRRRSGSHTQTIAPEKPPER
jgi:hypothetical protein